MQLDQVADQRETDSQPAMRRRVAAFGLPNALENVGQDVGRDALARIADDDLDVRSDALEPNLDPSPAGRELHRVLQEIPDDLLQAPGVTADPQARFLQYQPQQDVLGLGGVTNCLEPILDDAAQVDRLHAEPQVARRDSRHGEHVVDDPDLRVHVADDDLHRAPPLRLAEPTVVDERGPSVDYVEWVAQLVRERRQSLVPRAIRGLGHTARRLGLAPEPGAFDRNGGLA